MSDHTQPQGQEQSIFVLLDDTLSGKGAVLFDNPSAVIRCDRPEEVEQAFAAIAEAQAAGKYLAGFLSYELGYLLEDKLAPLLPQERSVPLLWFGVFDAPQTLSSKETERFLANRRAGNYRLWDLMPSMDEGSYCEAIGKVRDYIAAGDTYQVNYTFKHRFRFEGSPIALYQQLRQRQNVAHGAYIEAGDFRALSLSPELFLTTEGKDACTRPMKGTAPRGASPEEDEEQRQWLRRDEKSRAENLMIVDLLRNDMGRVCETGSVKVTELFTVETYRTLHQMTSHVVGRLRDEITSIDLIRHLFPCGSITGAPKVRTMEIIRELEQEARGIYTGSIGSIAPNGDTYFNVAIRTLALDNAGKGEMGIGSGIVYDSNPVAEYQECLLKGRFLSGNRAAQVEVDFDLIETLRWQEGSGYLLLEEHLDRLESSAGFFGFPCEREAIQAELHALAQGLSGTQRVRLLLHKDGATTLTHTAIELAPQESAIRYALAEPVADSSDIFFYHKTTRRAFYEDELARQQKRCGCDEALFVNERGEITEGARSNVFIEKDGKLFTPPLSSGILNGTFRRHLLSGGAEELGFTEIEEKILTLRDVAAADAVYFGNSVRGLQRAERAD